MKSNNMVSAILHQSCVWFGVLGLYAIMVAPLVAQPQIRLQPTNSTVSIASDAVFAISATSTDPINYQWRFNGIPLDPAKYPSASTKALSLTNLTVINAGQYDAVIHDANGSVTSRVVTLTVDPTFTKITTGPGELKPVLAYSSSANWWDYDNDGYLDILMAYGEITGPGRNRLYHNERNGTFVTITNVITAALGYHFTASIGDYDNDGNEDLFIACSSGAQELYRSMGDGGLTRITSPLFSDALPSSDAAWVDYNRDGFLDLYRANGIFSASNDTLYRHHRDGTFTKATAKDVGPIVTDNTATYGCTWGDYDNDGWQDVWVATDRGTTRLYHNDQGIFRLVTDADNSILAQTGLPGAAAWADYNNDGYQDLFVAGIEGLSPPALHQNMGGKTFTNVTTAAGLSTSHRGDGANWADYDNDGFLDLYITADPPFPSVVYHNNGDGKFTSVDVGSPIHENVGCTLWGAAFGDYDNDGFLDLAVARQGGPNLFFHNNGNSNHWLKVKLTGSASNRSAIGAKVRMRAVIRGASIWQMREITGSSAWSGGSAGLPVHFGLGDATNVEALRIEWPSGIVQTLTNISAGQMLTITEHQAYSGPPPAFTGITTVTNGFRINVTEPMTGMAYILETSNDLISWTKLVASMSAGTVFAYTDASTTNYTRRFYRVKVP